MDKIRLATVFSGIGAIEQAFTKKEINYEIVFACDNGEREIPYTYEEIVAVAKKNKIDINNYVKKIYDKTGKINRMKESYFANYDISEDRWYEDIRFIDGKKYKDIVDLFVGGSPCQSFSQMGRRAGLEDARGTLFYEYARLIQEMQPKAFIYENVPGMLTHDGGNTWKVITEIFEELNYSFKVKVINSLDCGIPQNRKRLFVVGFKKSCKFEFPAELPLTCKASDFYETIVDSRYYLGKKGFEFVTTHPARASINRDIIRTQKANQQFNWNGDFIFQELKDVANIDDILPRAYIGEYNGKKGVIRQLTHRECMRLMGFSDNYKIVVPNMWAYRQAGNSIVVNVLEEILGGIIKCLKIK